ncbi:MAG: hypothetical protein SPL57_06585 [Lachnospiraceae bacterium]|nr:hypothetical protein [Lachnospiraceae bacterium]
MRKKRRQQENVADTEAVRIEKTYTTEIRLHPRRVMMTVIIISVSVIAACLYAYRGGLATGGVLCEALVILPLCLTFALFMINERRSGRLWYDDTEYEPFTVMYVIAEGLLFVLTFFLPDYLSPVMIVALLLSSFRNRLLSMTGSFIIISSFVFGLGSDMHTVCILYCEAVIAVMLSSVITEASGADRAFLSVMTASVQFIMPLSGRYFNKLSLERTDLIYAAIEATATAIYGVFIMPAVTGWVGRERRYSYQTIIDNDYPLIEDIKLFSADEYERARKLSVLSLKAAQEIGADPYLAAAGGLYYRVGLIRGDKEIDCAMEIAAENGFPEKLTAILYEYQGLIRRPTTRESAIVHMCDSVIRRLDAISRKGDQMESGWNKQMLIYQAFNDLSLSGIYDDSGISINQFLRIRDRLVKEL